MRQFTKPSLLAALFLGWPLAALAQDAMPGMAMPASAPPADAAADDEPLGAGPSVQSNMMGALGNYSMDRDASGTSWEPTSTVMEGMHGLLGDWSTMLHGRAYLIYDNQGGPRGDSKLFSESMLMGMMQRQLETGQVTLRAMVSLDPFMGKSGYPLLLQTGETADGVNPLVDRQHPHDLFMELAGVYTVPVGEGSSVFFYAGYPGEPALGPPTFMHRFSAMENPEAPISHHWLDSTHITYGVLTTGAVIGDWKIEGSVFNGREPDRERWNFDSPRLDSASARLSWNPSDDLSFQVSYGFIKSPEQLDPDVDQHRFTASAMYNRKLEHGDWQTTFAWGENADRPGPRLNAYLLESAMSWYGHTVFARAESAEKNELFEPPSPLAGKVFDVTKFSLGYVYDIPVADDLSIGFGGEGSAYSLPSALDPAYGSSPTSYMLFTRLTII